MNHYSKSALLAILTWGVAFAAVLKFNPLKMTEKLQSEMQEVMDLIMKPHSLSRYIPDEVYENLGLNPGNRLMSYRWRNCGDKSKEVLWIHNITFSPDPLKFPGVISVSFDLGIEKTVKKNLMASVLMEKMIGSTTLKIPCIGNIGSCTYKDLCGILGQIKECPPQFKAAKIPCNCPFSKGEYKLPTVSFEVDASFLPTGDFHIQANLSTTKEDRSCYDIYFSVE